MFSLTATTLWRCGRVRHIHRPREKISQILIPFRTLNLRALVYQLRGDHKRYYRLFSVQKAFEAKNGALQHLHRYPIKRVGCFREMFTLAMTTPSHIALTFSSPFHLAIKTLLTRSIYDIGCETSRKSRRGGGYGYGASVLVIEVVHTTRLGYGRRIGGMSGDLMGQSRRRWDRT
ncbi:uncharacterized protein K460DRAFT_79968 [Cucurbitaria berberidis CBS 394.84]|uniref:Uncharacterized protein n=1 Tax=Cucurbitaria berberidis CBS 394.84 TaxID=1168544 RepID=A0A9P4GN42_9PLEO|nr:uncharacterized protein K460DRAFT_79968 [Cucurbitaria berberidis CBS 394.84]KAF1848702.1 hypothetical protein K460DRAFT_79968 [Cucurbitaria berberidis CBS 394.84]